MISLERDIFQFHNSSRFSPFRADPARDVISFSCFFTNTSDLHVALWGNQSSRDSLRPTIPHAPAFSVCVLRIFSRGALRALHRRYVKFRRLISPRPHMNKAPVARPTRYRRAITAPCVPAGKTGRRRWYCTMYRPSFPTFIQFPRTHGFPYLISRSQVGSGEHGWVDESPLGSKLCSWLFLFLFFSRKNANEAVRKGQPNAAR